MKFLNFKTFQAFYDLYEPYKNKKEKPLYFIIIWVSMYLARKYQWGNTRGLPVCRAKAVP